MHFLQHLMTYMLPIQKMVFGQSEITPEGFKRVVTNTGSYVVTSRSKFLIAKDYN